MPDKIKVTVITGNSLQQFKDALAVECFGMTKDDAVKDEICIDCREPALPKCSTDISRSEYRISGLCEMCWNRITR